MSARTLSPVVSIKTSKQARTLESCVQGVMVHTHTYVGFICSERKGGKQIQHLPRERVLVPITRSFQQTASRLSCGIGALSVRKLCSTRCGESDPSTPPVNLSQNTRCPTPMGFGPKGQWGSLVVITLHVLGCRHHAFSEAERERNDYVR